MIEFETARWDRQASFSYCQLLARKTAKNFYFSFLTLPADVRRDMCALYAYMRVCDDLGDDIAIPLDERRRLLTQWRQSVATALQDGPTDHPVLPALVDVVQRRAIPIEPLLEVIDGIEMDLSPFEIANFAQLENYCYHVAGTVGLCCIHIWGFTGEEPRDLAIQCGLAFQLTNILRDLSEDAQNGRIYLPQEDFAQFSYPREGLGQGLQNANFKEFMRFQCDRARRYYKQSAPLSRQISPVGRPVLLAMRQIYGGLLDEIEKRQFDIFSGRVSLPTWKKLAIAAQSYWRAS